MENPFEIINERLERIENLLQKISSNGSDGNMNIIAPKIMNLTELADYLNVSKSHIYKLTSRHEIPHSKRGKKIYFDRDTINTWVLENKIWTNEDIENEASEYLAKRGRHFKGY